MNHHQETSKLSCKLNTTENACRKQNVTTTKLQKGKKGLHFGAQKVDPGLFAMKEQENIRETPIIILHPSNFQIGKDNLETLKKAKENSVDEERDNEKTTEKNEFIKATEKYLLELRNRPEHTHSAQQSMISIHENWSNKRTEKIKERAFPDYEFNKKYSISASEINCTDATHEARSKFGSVKSISSEQFFGNAKDTSQYKSELLRFKNSTSISSDDLFQRQSSDLTLRDIFSTPLDTATVDDMSECLRKGVSKVAGKLGSAVNDLITRTPHEFVEL